MNTSEPRGIRQRRHYEEDSEIYRDLIERPADIEEESPVMENGERTQEQIRLQKLEEERLLKEGLL